MMRHDWAEFWEAAAAVATAIDADAPAAFDWGTFDALLLSRWAEASIDQQRCAGAQAYVHRCGDIYRDPPTRCLHAPRPVRDRRRDRPSVMIWA